MESRKPEKELNAVLNAFKAELKAEFKNKTLKELKFPPSEYWRFFIEIDRQNPGKAPLEMVTLEYKKTLSKMKAKAKIKPPKDQEEADAAKKFLEYINQFETEYKKSFLQEILELKLKSSDLRSSNFSPSGFKSLSDMKKKMYHFGLVDMLKFLDFCIDKCINEEKGVLNKELKRHLSEEEPPLRENLPLGQLIQCTNGWLKFEITEPGCVEAFIRKLPQMGIPREASFSSAQDYAEKQIKFIQEIHGEVVQGVAGIEEEDNDYQFRTIGRVGFHMIMGSNASEKGLSEMKERTISLRKKFPFYEPKISGDLKGGMYSSIVAKESEGLFGDQIQERITKIMSYLLEEFYEQLKKATTPLQKLTLILSHVRDMEQLHPFPDANCRTLCMLYFNHLLILNGFPPCILPNANRFDGCSIDELISDAIEGMRNTLKIINGKPLADITTQEIMDFLKQNGFKKEEAYAQKRLRIHYPPPISLSSPRSVASSSSPSSLASPLSPESSASPISPKSPSSPQSDFKLEENFSKALDILKEYIKNHEWKIAQGGSSITLKKDDGLTTIKVPKTVLLQWEAIHEQKGSSEDKYNAVVKIARDANKDSLVSYRLFGLGKRSEDTIKYLKKFEKSMTPDQIIAEFNSAQPTKKLGK
jgi:hypothetical protein